jgi:hypothetical protein
MEECQVKLSRANTEKLGKKAKMLQFYATVAGTDRAVKKSV